MCINCNLISPIHHRICDLLGIEYNLYGIVSNTFKHLVFLLADMSICKKHDNIEYGKYKPSKYLQSKSKLLYDYLVDHDLIHYLYDIVYTNDYACVVEQSFINYLFYTYFDFDVDSEKDSMEIVSSFRVPVDLLTDDPKRLISCFTKVTFKQKEIIPDEHILKYKLIRENADKYNIIILDSQKFYEYECER